MLGVSADTPAKQKKFKDKYELPYSLLADVDKKMCDAYGVIKEKSLYGKKYMGIDRTTVLVDAEGRVAHIFHPVKPEGHAEEVLGIINSQVR